MKELIFIQGADLKTVQKSVRQAVSLCDDDSITTLCLFATPQKETFALRPNKMCMEWDFISFCYQLLYAFDNVNGVRFDAWFKSDDAMDDLPAGKMAHIEFNAPAVGELTLVDAKCNRYIFAAYTDEESGAECLQIERSGTADFKPYPKLKLSQLPVGEGRFEVGKNLRHRKKVNLWYRMAQQGWIGLIGVVLIMALSILGVIAVWDFSETLLPFSLPFWTGFAIPAAIGLVLALTKVLFRDSSLWTRFINCSFLSAIILGLAMTLVFSVNGWFESSDTIYGRGTIVKIDSIRDKHSSNSNYSYAIDVSAPSPGKLYIRMYHDDSFIKGETVTIHLHRGLYGMFHAEKIEHQ
ncbi:MAG: hypothetical protein IJQ89_00060 [Bacteroidales bacterium]|nr:hypothetical protein [Bacteroidales bacterium]